MDWDAAIREHEAKLVVGVRVRVCVGECPWPYHHVAENGALGTVVPIPVHSRWEAEREGHSVGVRFDSPGLAVDGVTWWGSGYNAAELMPLDDAARR